MARDGLGAVDGGIVVDVWSDVMCPFCHMGDTLLEQALERFPRRDAVEVRYHSFLLMPELPVGTAVDLTDLLATKYGASRAQADAMNAGVAERGRQLGLDYRFERAVTTNMRQAHELAQFAASAGVGHDMIRRLFVAYFTEGRDLGDRDVLADLAAEAGLDRDAAAAVLAGGEFAQAVDDDLSRARQIGITGVPFFVFDGTHAVSGAQPVEVFLEALDAAWNRAAGRSAQAAG